MRSSRFPMTARWRCWVAAELAAGVLLIAGCSLPGDEDPAESAVRHPPVVFVVFDEFPADDLLRPDGSIDAEQVIGTNAGEFVRIQVRSKLTETLAGKASVLKCSESDLEGTRRGQKAGRDIRMTHVAFVLVETGRRFAECDAAAP